jgi:hypothetical protein
LGIVIGPDAFPPFFTLAMSCIAVAAVAVWAMLRSTFPILAIGSADAPRHEEIMPKKTSTKQSTPKPKTVKQTKLADSVPSPKAKPRPKPGSAKK